QCSCTVVRILSVISCTICYIPWIISGRTSPPLRQGLTLPLKKCAVRLKHQAVSGLHPVISIVMGDRHPASDSSGAVRVRVVKIIITNFACSPSAIPAAFGSVGLHLDVVTMVMTKHPPPAAQVIGVAPTLLETFW